MNKISGLRIWEFISNVFVVKITELVLLGKYTEIEEIKTYMGIEEDESNLKSHNVSVFGNVQDHESRGCIRGTELLKNFIDTFSKCVLESNGLLDRYI